MEDHEFSEKVLLRTLYNCRTVREDNKREKPQV